MTVLSKRTVGYFLILLALVPWALIQLNLRIPGDTAFLYSATQMLLEGKSMTEYFYDTNPPMSFFIYIPAVFLNALGLTSVQAVQFYIMGMTLLCYLLSIYYLSRNKELDTSATLIFLAAYIGSVTILPYIEYGQKDLFIAITIVPFLLMQLGLIKGHQHNKLIQVVTVLLCVPFILLKPHFGLLPVILLAMHFQKNGFFRTIKGPDFIGLALGTLLYIALIYIVTPDYITEALPNSVAFYVGRASVGTIHQTSLAAASLCMIIYGLAYFHDKESESKNLAQMLSLLAIASVVSFWTQGKGYSLHLIPTVTILSIAAGQLLYIYLKDTKFSEFIDPMYRGLIILALFYVIFSYGKPILTHEEYRNTSLAKILKEQGDNQPFFMETYTTNVVETQALYSGVTVASRFPSLWFLSVFYELNEEKQKALWLKFGAMITEDFKRHKPKVVALIKPTEDREGFHAFFKNHPDFKEEWKSYEYSQDYILSSEEYRDFLFQKDNRDVVYEIFLRK